jgi:hypothetical protein
MKNYKILLPVLGVILLGLSSWVLITLVELQTLVAIMQEELMGLDKVIGRIYNHIDRLTSR